MIAYESEEIMAEAHRQELRKSTGVIKTLIKLANNNWKTHTFTSPKIDFVSIKNASTVDLRIAWDTDDKEAVSDPVYTVLAAGERLPTVRITEDTEMHYTKDSGAGIDHRIEIIAWG